MRAEPAVVAHAQDVEVDDVEGGEGERADNLADARRSPGHARRLVDLPEHDKGQEAKDAQRTHAAANELGLRERLAVLGHKRRARVVEVEDEKGGAGKGIVHGALERVVA